MGKITEGELTLLEGKDSELTIFITSKLEGKRSRVKIEDINVIRHLEYLDEAFDEVLKETGHLPNMVGLDEFNFRDLKSYTRVREKLTGVITEVNVLKRQGRSYCEFYYMDDSFQWYFPIRNNFINKWGFNIPYYQDPAGFAVDRKFDKHTGVDIHCSEGSEIFAVESGEIINIENFTGPLAGSPWWNNTQAIWIRGASGIVVYGEVTPLVKIGQKVTPDTMIGKVSKVLSKDKGTPTSMLHLELYSEGMHETAVWKLNEPKPKYLKDPTPYLIRSLSLKKPNALRFIKDGEDE